MNVLTQRIGPLPAWVWGVVAAGGVWFFLIRGRAGSSSTTGAGSTQGNQLSSGYSLGYAQGVQAAGPGAVAPPAAATGKPSMVMVRSGSGVFAQPAFDLTQLITWTQTDTSLPSAGAPVAGGNFGQGNQQSHFWQPVTYQGQTAYVWAPYATPVQGGVGGAPRKHHIGARSRAGAHSDAHPLVGAPVRYAHFVRAVGGPANHQREIHRVASQSGVHPARIAMLNPEPTGMIRVA